MDPLEGRMDFEFETLSLTPLAGSSICGRVFASEPQPAASGGGFVNNPLAGVVVGTGSVIGANVILNTSCTVDHHSRVGDHAHL